MKKLIALLSLAVMIIMPSCKSKNTAVDADASTGATRSVAVSMPYRDSKPVTPDNNIERPAYAIPKATAFKMSGDYAEHVAVSLDSQGNLSYFPAPSDISATSAPVSLADGWWLNCQGIGANSVFTKYTFAEYAALPSVPSVNELKEAIIPGAKVTEFVTLPYSINEAPAHIAEINEFLQKNSVK